MIIVFGVLLALSASALGLEDSGSNTTAMNISGVVFEDIEGKPGLTGWIVNLIEPDGSEDSRETGADGSYRFENLAPGEYTVSEVLQDGWDATTPEGGSQRITLTDSDATDVSFGNAASSQPEPGQMPEQSAADLSPETESSISDNQGSQTEGGNEETPDWLIPDASSHRRTLDEQSNTLSISGVIFKDFEGKPGLAGWTVNLAGPDGSEDSTETGADGSYRFENLAPGKYKVSEVLQDGWDATTSDIQKITLTDSDAMDVSFGNAASLDEQSNTLSISGHVYEDPDFYDLRIHPTPAPPVPRGLADWTVILTKPDSSEASISTRTDTDGSYIIGGLTPGEYTVSEILQDGWNAIFPEGGSQRITLTDSDATGVNFENAVSPQSKPGQDEQSNILHDIWGTVFNDMNRDGVPNGERGLSGWTVKLDGGEIDTTTGIDGSYIFYNRTPGVHTVSEVLKPGWSVTTPAGESQEITLTSESDVTNVNFGNVRLLHDIQGTVFNDRNGNGALDGEPGLSGWTIKLTRSDGGEIGQLMGPEIDTMTGIDGVYRFYNLTAGVYTVSEVPKSSWSITTPAGESQEITLSDSDMTDINFGNVRQAYEHTIRPTHASPTASTP